MNTFLSILPEITTSLCLAFVAYNNYRIATVKNRVDKNNKDIQKSLSNDDGILLGLNDHKIILEEINKNGLLIHDLMNSRCEKLSKNMAESLLLLAKSLRRIAEFTGNIDDEQMALEIEKKAKEQIGDLF